MNETKNHATVEMPGMEAFTFGDPIPAMEQWQTLWGECHNHQLWYAPPDYQSPLCNKNYAGLSPLHHSSAIFVKREIWPAPLSRIRYYPI